MHPKPGTPSDEEGIEEDTVLVDRFKGSCHCMDLKFSLFDAECYALFDGVIFGIGLCN